MSFHFSHTQTNEELNDRLRIAVKLEHYEIAAALRDEITRREKIQSDPYLYTISLVSPDELIDESFFENYIENLRKK